MKSDLTLQTRREFLRRTVLTSALSWTVPTFLANTFSALQAEAANRATQIATGRDATILVILQMAGGNDGINTVIPYRSDFYHKARPRIGIPAKQVLKLNDEVGLHPGLSGFKELFDAGQLAVIQGVGYPNPNRSHFRSTEIWQTASDSNQVEKYGWVGRYFDNACAGCDPTIAVSIGRQMPQAFSAKTPKSISLENPHNYRFVSSGGRRRKGEDLMEHSYRELNEDDDANSGGSIGAIGGPAMQPGGSVLDFIERTALDAQISSDEIRAISSRTENQASYPASQRWTHRVSRGADQGSSLEGMMDSMNRLLTLGFLLATVSVAHGADWIRPGVSTNQPVWGVRGGLVWAVAPGGFRGGEPRGLIRLGYPVLPGKRYDLINFIAVEPVVQGRRGFSELERQPPRRSAWQTHLG